MKIPLQRLGELCQMVKGTSPTLRTPPGPYPLVVTAEFRRTSDTWQLEGPAVCIPLISSTGHGDAALHRVHFQEGKFALANLLVALLPRDRALLDAKYLYHLLMAQKDQLLVPLMLGTANVSLKEKDIANVEIPLPPLAEQRRVVARIEELAAQIHEARTLRQQSAEQAEALYLSGLGAAMTPHGTPWKRETVNDVALSMEAGWSPQCDDVPAAPGEWGVLKTTSVQWCDFQPQHNKALPKTLEPVESLLVKAGDVLVTRAGPRKRVGVVAAVRRDEPRLTISDKTIRIRANREKIEPRFLELSLAAPFSQEHLVQRKTGLADAQVNISQAILRATPVAYPPLTEQRRIVAELDALQAEVDALKRLQAETAAELDALLPAILDRAFKGDL
ncbi:restriction endonuclease subunit S [Congregicoccus parvus]|uniref:restriction endonuclease subunit S n=1 Tax=Congregicoccus parvus TaxID=3081749 RepID=UPI003FA57CD1